MDRREYLKSLFLTPLAGGLIACRSSSGNLSREVSWARLPNAYSYGRTEAEKQTDASLFAQSFFREHELITIAVLCDIILPGEHPNGGALDAGLPDFVEFMVKDRPRHQLPIRGGIAWLDSHAIERFDADFVSITEDQRLSICDEIAYPDAEVPPLQPGIAFFSLMRNLTMTGYLYYRSGLRDLGYAGNTPNVWDGVPDQVLRKHNKRYQADWLAKCVDQSRRDITAEWDEDGNLIS